MEMKLGPLGSLVENWLNDRRRCEATKDTYRRVFIVFNRFVQLNSPAQNALGAERKDVVAFRQSLTGKSSHTVCMYMSVVKMFYAYAYQQRKVRTNIATGISSPGVKKFHNKKPLSDAQAKALMSSIDTTTEIGRRDRLILLLMLQAGLRCIEVSRMDRCDAYRDGNEYRLKLQRKGRAGKDDTIDLRKDLGEELESYMHATSTENDTMLPMFYSLSSKAGKAHSRLSSSDVGSIVTSRMDAANVKGKQLSPHSLRHTFGCNLVRKGVTLEKIQLMMGHASPETTMIYVRDAKELEIRENNPAELLDKL